MYIKVPDSHSYLGPKPVLISAKCFLFISFFQCTYSISYDKYFIITLYFICLYIKFILFLYHYLFTSPLRKIKEYKEKEKIIFSILWPALCVFFMIIFVVLINFNVVTHCSHSRQLARV